MVGGPPDRDRMTPGADKAYDITDGVGDAGPSKRGKVAYHYRREPADVLFEDHAMTPQAARTYEYDVDVAADDIDEMGRVNNSVYLKWVQAAVLSHWCRLVPKEVVAAHLWVALKHEIRYRHPAFLNDHLVVRVVLEKLFGARAFYKTMIKHGDDVLAEVESSWCCLDSVTQKPVRLARDIVARFLPSEALRHC